MDSVGDGGERYEKFLRLYLQDQRQIFAYVRSLLPNHADAQDVFQRCSLTLWKNFDSFDGQRLFLPWACRFAFNEVRNFRRTAGRDRLHFADDLAEELAERRVESLASGDGRLAALRQCLSQLKPDDRELLRAAYEDESSIAQAAAAAGRAVQTLYNRLSALRRTLLQCVENRMRAEEATG